MEQKPRTAVKRFFQSWAITTLAVLLADILLPGIHSSNWGDLLLASLLLGVLNAFVRPLLMLLALPLLVVTFGLFMLVINALLLMFVGQLVPGFQVDGFGSAVLGSLGIGFISMMLNLFAGTGQSRIQIRSFGRQPQRPRRPSDDGGGPVIDI